MTGCKLSLGVLKRFASPFFLADAFLRTHPPLFSGFNTFSAIAAQQARISWAQKETAQTPHMRVFNSQRCAKDAVPTLVCPLYPAANYKAEGGAHLAIDGAARCNHPTWQRGGGGWCT